MSSSTFAQARSQALTLEKQTDTLLSKYSRFQNGTTPAVSDEEQALVDQISDLLVRHEDVISKLNRISETDPLLSTSKLQQLTRHRENLHLHQAAFHKIQTRILDERNRSNLLFSIRSDISQHEQRSTQLNDNDYTLDERVRVDSANTFADRLLRLAYDTRDELMEQRFYLNNALLKMMGVLLTIPGINVLVSKINTRRRRDTLILATVIAVCIVFLIWVA